MNILKRIIASGLLACGLIGNASFIHAADPNEESLECVICTEQCFDANYNPILPVVVLHQSDNAAQRPHTICRSCYNELRQRDNKCPDCREIIDAAFINNQAEQHQVLNERRHYLQAQKAQQNARHEPQQSAQNNPIPVNLNSHQNFAHDHIRYASLFVCLLPGFWRWYVHQLALIL